MVICIGLSSRERDVLISVFEKALLNDNIDALKLCVIANDVYSALSDMQLEKIAAKLYNAGHEKFVLEFLDKTSVVSVITDTEVHKKVF